jgi:hypothetical protein
MINPNNPHDAMLKQRIDAIFKKYDTNHNGTLSLQELHVFLNDLLASAGNSHRVTSQEAQNVMRAIDQNGDGRINKYELFHCFKYLTATHRTNGQMPQKMTGQHGTINSYPAQGVNRQVPPAMNPMVGYGPMAGGIALIPGMMGIMPVCPMTYGAPVIGMGIGMPVVEFDACGPMNMGFGMFDW